MKKRALSQRNQSMGLIVGLVGIVILAGWLVWDGAFAPPDKGDFTAAKSTAEELKRGVDTLDTASTAYVQAIVASLRTNPTGKSLATDTKDVKANYEQASARLTDLTGELTKSAAARDAEVKQAVASVEAQQKAATRFFATFTSSYDDFYRTYISCDDVSRFVAPSDAATAARSFTSAATDCIKDLDTLAKVETLQSIKDYAKKRRDIVADQHKAYDDTAKSGTDKKALNAWLAALDEQIRRLDPLGDLQNERTEATGTAAVDQLIALLTIKAS